MTISLLLGAWQWIYTTADEKASDFKKNEAALVSRVAENDSGLESEINARYSRAADKVQRTTVLCLSGGALCCMAILLAIFLVKGDVEVSALVWFIVLVATVLAPFLMGWCIHKTWSEFRSARTAVHDRLSEAARELDGKEPGVEDIPKSPPARPEAPPRRPRTVAAGGDRSVEGSRGGAD